MEGVNELTPTDCVVGEGRGGVNAQINGLFEFRHADTRGEHVDVFCNETSMIIIIIIIIIMYTLHCLVIL